MMRQNELINGIDIFDSDGNPVGESRLAAVKGISQVVGSRIVSAAPGMTLLPIIMDKLEKYRWMRELKSIHAQFQVLVVGCFLLVMVPAACSLFPQKCSIQMSTIERFERTKYQDIKSRFVDQRLPTIVYFNKGL